MKRFQDWPKRLLALVEERKHVPFAWGSQDCCLFACDCVVAMTGEDPAETLRGYTDNVGADEAISQFGNLEALVEAKCAEFEFKQLSTPLKGQRGDLVLFDNNSNPAIGVCIGGAVAFAGRDGLEFHPLRDCRRAWRVG